TPSFHSRIRSLTTRQRLTLLLTCSIRSRRWCRAWLASSCSSVSSWPRGFLVGMRISTWGSVNARKPRSCKRRLPGARDTAACRSIAEGTQGGKQHGQEDVNPLVGFPLHHPEQASLHHLEGVSLQGGEHEEQPIFRRRQGAVFVHGKPTSGPRLPIHPPRRH